MQDCEDSVAGVMKPQKQFQVRHLEQGLICPRIASCQLLTSSEQACNSLVEIYP